MNTATINISNIRKDEQFGKLEFTANGTKYSTNARGDGLFVGEKKLFDYKGFSVRGLDAAHSNTYLSDWLLSNSLPTL
jgi:hypothetical protein